MNSKYESLEIFLQSKPGSDKELSLSFSEVEAIIGNKLPASAHKYREWWANQKDSKNGPQAKAWLSAGFNVDSVQLREDGGWVLFKRQ